MQKKLLLVAIATAVLIAGYVYFFLNEEEEKINTNIEVTSDDKTKQENTNGAQIVFAGAKLANNYYEYTAQDYAAARAASKPIFLYFYANWCPTCAAQEPIVVDLMNSLDSSMSDLVAFRVNFNDNATSEEERQIANQYGVRYQHTMFTVSSAGEVTDKLLGQYPASALLASFAEITK